MLKNSTSIGGTVIKRLILHFNVDKSIVMKDSLEYNNTDFYVMIKYLPLNLKKIYYP